MQNLKSQAQLCGILLFGELCWEEVKNIHGILVVATGNNAFS